MKSRMEVRRSGEDRDAGHSLEPKAPDPMSSPSEIVFLVDVDYPFADRLTTVWPPQGHYAFDPQAPTTYLEADPTVERIGYLINYRLPAWLGEPSSSTSRYAS